MKRSKTIEQFMEDFNNAPSEIRYLSTAIALQKQYNYPIGISFYQECKEKYPEYFDADGNVIFNEKKQILK